MSRVLLLTSSILLQFCIDGLAADGSTSVEVDGLEGVDRGTDVEDDEDGKVNLMGADYFGGWKDGSFQFQNLVGSSEYQYSDSIEQLSGKRGKKGKEAEIVILDSMDTRNYKAEVKAGNKADVLGINPHYYQPDVYPDFGRRFVLQYPYTEVAKNHGVVKPNSLTPKLVAKKHVNAVKPNSMTPKLVSPELFMAVAQKSALLDAARPKGAEDEFVRKDILRNGDYWNAVWKEDVDPLALRTKETKKLESVKAEIPPGSKLYDLLSKLKHLSPTLLYVINERES